MVIHTEGGRYGLIFFVELRVEQLVEALDILEVVNFLIPKPGTIREVAIRVEGATAYHQIGIAVEVDVVLANIPKAMPKYGIQSHCLNLVLKALVKLVILNGHDDCLGHVFFIGDDFGGESIVCAVTLVGDIPP